MVQSGAKVTGAIASSRSDTGQHRAKLAAVQLAQSRVSGNLEASVTTQSLATIRTQVTDASY